MHSIKVTIIMIYIIFLQGCDTTEPKIVENIVIQKLDVAVTEAYIHVSFESEKDRNLILLRDRENIFNFSCCSIDTIITDTTLMQNANYKSEVKEYKNNSIFSESNVINSHTYYKWSKEFLICETHYFKDQTMLIYKYSILVFDHKYKMRWFCV